MDGGAGDHRHGKPISRGGAQAASQHVDQTNNAYIFPGIGLGAIAARARRVSNGMLMAAAQALADISPARLDAGAALLPPVSELRLVAYRVAVAVAMQAQAEGLADAIDPDALAARVQARMWSPSYRSYRRRC